jgi:hypothetical protein
MVTSAIKERRRFGDEAHLRRAYWQGLIPTRSAASAYARHSDSFLYWGCV